MILCDSCYAMNAVEERMEVSANVELIELARKELAAVRETRSVVFVHVLGHSEDPGNERADELVQWGKQDTQNSRLHIGGEREGQGWREPVADYAERRAARLAAKAKERADRRQQQERCAGTSTAGLLERGSPRRAAARERPEGRGSRRGDQGSASAESPSAGRFSTVGMRAAVDELENGPDIGWRLGVLLDEEIEEDSNNNGKTDTLVGRVSFVGSLGHTLAE